MKNLLLLFLIGTLSQFAFGQQESFGEFTYFEQIDGQKVTNISMPYLDGCCWITVMLHSGYGFSMHLDKRDSLLQILDACQKSTVKSRTLIGEFKPGSVFKKEKSSDQSVLASVKMSFFSDGKNIIISFPNLNDELNAFFGKTSKAEGHTFYIPRENIVDFINCFKVDLTDKNTNK